MKMAGEQRIAAPRARVWDALNDPDILRASIPGCQSLDRAGDNGFTAIAEVKIGPIGARFKGDVALSELDPPNGYLISGKGNGGIAGSAKGSARVRLSDDGRGGTLVSYEVDAEVGGRMAQLGGPIIDATARQLAGKFFSRFGEVVSGAAPNAAVAPPGTAPAAAVAASLPASAGPTASRGSPVTWLLALVVAALVGFLIGRSQGDAASDWAGLAIGLIVVVASAAAFEYGRRSATPVVTLDAALLRRLIEGGRE